MNKPKIVHLVFYEKNHPLELSGLFKIGAHELFIFKQPDATVNLVPTIQSAISIHEIDLPPIVGEKCEIINDTLDKFAFQQGVLTCVNISYANPLDITHVTLALQAGLETFHRMNRPSAGHHATGIVYYNKENGEVHGHPLISLRDEDIQRIFWWLIGCGAPATKKEILAMLNDVYDEYTYSEVTNAMILLENWLAYYPGFSGQFNKQREKAYQILPLDKVLH